MADYADIHGKRVKVFDSDPTLTSSYEGQVWYDLATGNLKSVVASEAFSSGAPLATGRASGAGAGTQTAALYNGGNPDTNICENYNGTGWAAIANMNNNHQYAGGCGTETSALIYGDYPEANTTEEFNGSAWSAQEGFSTARRSGASFGLETAALLCGGTTGPATSTATEEYNGESWSGGGALSQARQYFAGTGTETAGLVFGGSNNPNSSLYTNTEEYNGSSWTSGGALPAGRSMMFSWGTQTAGALSGGALPSTTNTCLKYDGSSWSSSSATMGTATKQGYTSGVGTSQSAGLTAGGDSTVARTEEFNISANVITAGAWASAANMGTARASSGGTGTPTAAMCISGRQSGYPPDADITNAETFDGTSWTAISPVLKSRYNAKACGPNGAVAWVGGNSDVSPGGNQNKTEEWNGSSWTQGGTLSRNSENLGVFGVQTSCVACGGSDSPYPNFNNRTDEYNGTAWTAYPTYTISANIGGMAGSGTETAGVISGGESNTVPSVLTTQEYNGSAWTTVNNAVHATSGAAYGSVGSSQTSTFSICGNPAGTASMHYDGTNWSTAPNTALGASSVAGAGTVAEGVVFGGQIPGSSTRYANTEIFNQETTAVNVKTLTTS